MPDRLPTALFVDSHLKTLEAAGRYYYFIQKGNAGSGLITLKLNNLAGKIRLLTQQRDFMNDILIWAPALENEIITEAEADSHIQREISRDPDIWVIEIEDPDMINPFDA